MRSIFLPYLISALLCAFGDTVVALGITMCQVTLDAAKDILGLPND